MSMDQITDAVLEGNLLLYWRSMAVATMKCSTTEGRAKEVFFHPFHLGRRGYSAHRFSNFWLIGYRLESWTQRNNCTGKTEHKTHDGDVHHTSWTCGGINGLVEHYKVDSLGRYSQSHGDREVADFARALLGRY